MHRFNAHHALLAAAALAATVLAGVVQGATPCAELVHLNIAAAEIGLPSSGAIISSAAIGAVPVDPMKPEATREYCKVLGAVQPVDPNAPPVNFQVNLPVQWNGKAVQCGNQ
jgi:feruloyl esterase